MKWNLVKHRAIATRGQTALEVDTDDLRTGLRIMDGPWQGSVIGALPSILPPASPDSVETYERGTDLVTTHPATSERPTRIQLYWRRWHDLPSSIFEAIELIVSVQTHLLDSDPAIVIESRFPDTKPFKTEKSVCILTRNDSQLLIFSHPNDAAEIELIQDRESSGECRLRQTLFRQRLEKGVILRGRILFCWANRIQGADEIQASFLAAEPMLTA